MNLYNITNELMEQLEAPGINTENGEVDEQAYKEHLDSLQLSFVDKALNVAKFVLSLEAEQEAMKQAIAAMKTRMDAKKKKSEYLRTYLKDMCTKVDTWPSDAQVAISARKSTSVEITDSEKIPMRYKEKEIVWSISKKDIAASLKAGEQVPGAELKVNQNLQIK